MRPFLLRWWRPVAGATVLGGVLWWAGTGPFVDGLRSLEVGTLALGALLAVPATVACAWRWRLVAGALGVGLDLRSAIAGYYRSQFLNSTLPGGILGDVHRGVRHGRDTGDTGRGVRAVAWERLAGQVVQAAFLVAALLLLPSPLRALLPALLGGLAIAAVLVLAVTGLHRRGSVPLGVRSLAGLRFLADDLRLGLLARATWPGVVATSAVALACHVATYLVAARAVGVAISTALLVPLALVVLLVAALPLNVAGWGPREGASGWTFGAAGLGVELGVATAVAYGVLILVGSLPGAALLLVGRRKAHG